MKWARGVLFKGYLYVEVSCLVTLIHLHRIKLDVTYFFDPSC